MDVGLDDELLWVWCGVGECDLKLFGPYLTEGEAAASVDWADCDHDHTVTAKTPREIARSLPPSIRFDGSSCCFVQRDGSTIIRTTGAVDRERWLYLYQLMDESRTTCASSRS